MIIIYIFFLLSSPACPTNIFAYVKHKSKLRLTSKPMLWHKQSELRQLFPTVKLSGRLLWNLLTLLETFVEDLNNNLFAVQQLSLGTIWNLRNLLKNVHMKVFMFNIGSFKQGNDISFKSMLSHYIHKIRGKLFSIIYEKVTD